MHTPRPKIIIAIREGLIQAIHSNEPHIEVEVLNYDLLQEPIEATVKDYLKDLEQQYNSMDFSIY